MSCPRVVCADFFYVIEKILIMYLHLWLYVNYHYYFVSVKATKAAGDKWKSAQESLHTLEKSNLVQVESIVK